jgi:hypothetical protein
MAPGIKFNFLDFRPIVNEAGTIAFGALLSGVAPGTTDSIWTHDGSDFKLVVQAGSPAPGAGSGVAFGSGNMGLTAFNDLGRIAFTSGLVGPGVNSANEWGLWVQEFDGLHLVQREGAGVAPGTPFPIRDIFQVSMNNVGNVAFTANLLRPDSDPLDYGLWLYGPDGVRLVARHGDLFEVNPGDFRQINQVNIFDGTENNTHRGSSLNNRGELAFSLTFTDGSSGIFLFAVPEPGTAALIASAALCAAFIRRRELGS